MFPKNVLVYVLHVDNPKHQNRKNHIIDVMKTHSIPFEWMLKGDMEDINQDILLELFDSRFASASTPVVSCCYKHYLIWKEFLGTNYKYCLIFEDDVLLANDFVEKFIYSIVELEKKIST